VLHWVELVDAKFVDQPLGEAELGLAHLSRRRPISLASRTSSVKNNVWSTSAPPGGAHRGDVLPASPDELDDCGQLGGRHRLDQQPIRFLAALVRTEVDVDSKYVGSIL